MVPSTTLYEKVYDRHVVQHGDGDDLIYIDLHLLHEVTSPQAFEGLRVAGRTVRRPDLTIATMDHNVPTAFPKDLVIDSMLEQQLTALRTNTAESGVRLLGLGDPHQGIVHIIGPEMGLSQPGMTVVCGDSHTSTHGALGALGFGIGTSEVEHVLATQTLPARRSRTMAVQVDGELPSGVTAKDVILAIMSELGTGGGIGHVIEYRGSTISDMSIEGRMTICNMSIEAGARAGMVAPDDRTFAYLEGRPHAPQGVEWERALDDWRGLQTDAGAVFDTTVAIDATNLSPYVSWGTNPGQVIPLDDSVPNPDAFGDPSAREAANRALVYMGLQAGTLLRDVEVNTVFIGSCTNSRIEDLRAAAAVLDGRRVHAGVRAMVVPGSAQVRERAEAEGLDRIFTAAGFDWRQPGCSMCPAINTDRMGPGERSASTSNRNFEGRQGPRSRTHLVSPIVAAATAVAGHFATPGDLE